MADRRRVFDKGVSIEEIREWLAAEARASEHPFTRRATAGALAELDAAHAVLDWLISMDDPGNAEGLEARRTVTLTRIIDRAREARAARQAYDPITEET